MKKVTFGMLIICVIFATVLFLYPKIVVSNVEDNAKERDKYFNIMTSNKAMYLMVKELIQDRHNIEFLAKSKDDIKNLNIDDEGVKNISKMDFFIHTGVDFEPWVSTLVSKLNKDSVAIIDASRGIKLLSDNEGKKNSYYWMDFDNLKIALFNIKNELETYDPNNKDFYSKNYENIISSYNENYQKKLEAIKNSSESTDIYYSGDEVAYFSKYISNNSKSLDGEKLGNLLVNTEKKKIVLYSKDEDIEKYKGVLNSNNIILIKVDTYDENSDYVKILSKGIDTVFNGMKLDNN